jgi:hypothetical protein
MGVQRCTLRTDSKVVAGQIENECIAKEPTLEKYQALVRRMENHFKGFTVEYIKQTKNTEANELAKAATLLGPRVINIIEGEDWRAPIIAYLYHYYEPDSKNEQIRMQQRAKDYQIVSNELYKTSVSRSSAIYSQYKASTNRQLRLEQPIPFRHIKSWPSIFFSSAEIRSIMYPFVV